MSSSLFQRFGNARPQNINNNLASQIAMLKNDPGSILDILIQKEKITQQQYNELQQYRNNPEAIARYLLNSSRGNEIQQAIQTANNRQM